MNGMYLILSIQAAVLMIILIILCTAREPLWKQYDELVVHLCDSQEALQNEEDVLRQYPELRAVKQKIKHATELHAQCMQAFRTPAPASPESAVMVIRERQREARQLRKEIQQQLQQLALPSSPINLKTYLPHGNPNTTLRKSQKRLRAL